MGSGVLFDREFCEPLALIAAGSVCAMTGGAASAGFALFGAPAVALGAWSGSRWMQRLKNKTPDNAKAVAKIQGALVERLRGDGTLETIKPELRARLDAELPTLIAAHWPPPARIAKLSSLGDGFPSAVSSHVLEEIDGSAFVEALYEARPVRTFVRLVVETALLSALEDKAFFASLEPHLAIRTLELTGRIDREMTMFVGKLDAVEHVLSEAVPAILDSLRALHGKVDRMNEKLDLIVKTIVGDASASPQEREQTEQTIAEMLASDMRASRDAAELLSERQGIAAATSRLKQGLAEQSDARKEAIRNEVALLSQIAAINFYEGWEEALAALEKIVELVPDEIEIWNQLGLLRLRLGDLDGAQQAFQRVVDLSGTRRQFEAIAYGNMGIVARTRGDLDAAMRYHEQSLEIEKELGWKEGMASDYGNMGVVAQTRGDLDGAMRYFEQSLALNEELGRKEGMANDYGNMGNVALTRDNLDGAMRYYEQSLALNEELGRKEGMAIQYGNMGTVMHTRDDLDGAMRYYEQSLALNEELGRKEGMAIQYGNMGIVVRTRGDLDGARSLFKKALNLFREIGARPQFEHIRQLIENLEE